MWEVSSEDIPYLPSKSVHDPPKEERNPDLCDTDTIHNSSASSLGSSRSRNQRWGRSNFSPEEIQALDKLENPLPGEFPGDQIHQPQRLTQEGYIEGPILFSDLKSTPNVNLPSENSTVLTKCQKFGRIVMMILPALCFTAAAHFINGIMTDFKLFSATFSVFQGIFWPSFVFLVVDLIQGAKRQRSQRLNLENENQQQHPFLCTVQSRWKLGLLILLHSTLSSVAVILQLMSIQRLNISVSLALSFSSGVYIILINYISREKRCSLELIILSIVTYLGFIIVGIPAMTSKNNIFTEDLTMGLGASLSSMVFAIPSAFILRYLRDIKIYDSFIGTSFAFHGSLFSLLVKVIMESTVEFYFDPISIGWASGLIALVLFGTIFFYIGPRLFPNIGRKAREESHKYLKQSNISITRMLLFIFSCSWELVRQGVWHNFPSVYDIFGSLLVILGFLLAVAFDEWTVLQPKEVKDANIPFQFISWLFSR